MELDNMSNEFQRIFETQELNSHDVIPNFPFENKTSTCNVSKFYSENLKASWIRFHENMNQSIEIDNDLAIKYCIRCLKEYSDVSDNLWTLLNTAFTVYKDDAATEGLVHANLWPTLTPVSMLRWITNKIESNLFLNENIIYLCGAVAVLWSLEQRMLRCISYLQSGDSMKIYLKKELFENRPHENWSPKEYPQWLVLELEMNIMIRKIQVDVAQKMLNAEDNKNTVLQLNMGEGKTSVIIPLLVTAIADGTKIARVVVLKQLFNMNYNALVQKIGGIIITKRVYVLPCRRDFNLNEENVRRYKSIMEECKKKIKVPS